MHRLEILANPGWARYSGPLMPDYEAGHGVLRGSRVLGDSGLVTDRPDIDPADGQWVHPLVRRIRAAQADGDDAEVARLLNYGQAEGGEALARFVEQMVEAQTQRDEAVSRGEPVSPYVVGLARAGDPVNTRAATDTTGPMIVTNAVPRVVGSESTTQRPRPTGHELDEPPGPLRGRPTNPLSMTNARCCPTRTA